VRSEKITASYEKLVTDDEKITVSDEKLVTDDEKIISSYDFLFAVSAT
jgi:hypothetical protein